MFTATGRIDEYLIRLRDLAGSGNGLANLVRRE